jgi:hypothetical protein
VESNGTYIYASKFNGNSFVKFNTSGNYIGTFTIPGTTGIRDLAYDGTYFYGGNATNKIYKMNFTTQTLVDSISCPAGTYVSSIAYDSQNDAFWVSSGNSAIKLISRSGIQLDIIPAANHGLQWIIGSAYDHWSEGGPYLWLFDMGVNQNVSNIVQLKLSTKMPTGLVHDVTQDVAPAGSSAKGLFAKENLFQGTVTLGGIYWSPTYDGTFGYAIASTVPPLPLPQLVSPANYATDVDVNTPFTWTASTGASKYHIQVSTTPAFTSTVIDAFSTTTSYQASGLAYNTPYLWRVKALNDTSSSPWTDAWLFTTTMGNQTPWTFVRTTDSAQVIIPANINPMIGNRPFMQNDAIGFFYTDNNGALACGGFGVWNNNTLTVSVYGDNPLTTIKDGFAANETFTLKVWDAQALKEYPASATYLVGPDNYQSGAFSLLGSLYVYTTDTLHLNLQQGWNMVSSYFTPLTPNLFTLFDGFTSDVRIMKNGGGQNFIPAYNINTIGDWNVTDGYQISMTNSHVLDIVGVKVTPESTPLNLVSGWNLVSYLRSSSMAVAQALADLDGNLIICKNGLGEMYVPAWNVNSLGNMVPGDGYFMFTTNAQTFNYPANGALKSIVDETNITRPVMLKPTINRTGSDVSILLSVPGSQNGDEVGVWNQDGTLIGSGVVINGLAAITAWGDDESTPAKEGAAEGEPLTLKLLNNANKTLSDINPINITNLVNNDVLGILTFSRNGIYKVDAEVINMPDATLRIATSPNPVSQALKIDFNLPTGGNYDLSIFDVTGNKIGSISQSTGIQGMNTQYFDCGSLVDGVYNVVLTFGSSKQVQKISVVR